MIPPYVVENDRNKRATLGGVGGVSEEMGGRKM